LALGFSLGFADTAIGAIFGAIATVLLTSYLKRRGPIICEVDSWGMNFIRGEDIVTWATDADRAEYSLRVVLFNDEDVALFVQDISLRFARRGQTELIHTPIIKPTWTRPVEASLVEIIELPSRRLVLLSLDGYIHRSQYGISLERIAESDSVTLVGKLSNVAFLKSLCLHRKYFSRRSHTQQVV
jgi:hypothetical protein